MKKHTLIALVICIALATVSCSPSSNPTAPVTLSTSASEGSQPTATLPPATEVSSAEPDESQATAVGGSSESMKIGSALNLVIGTADRPSVYSSYHLESYLESPRLNDDNTAVVINKTKLSAEVQGKNIHLFYTPQGADQAKEGYLIGIKEYRVTNGKPEEMIGQIGLSWAGWHLSATFPFAAGASIATKTGTETLDGRQADVYTVDSAKVSPAVMEGFRTMGMFPLNTIKGTIWIDQKTGGALKANIDYEMDVVDNQMDKTVGTGKGHLDLAITQIDQVTVQAP